ncbi:MAG: DUF3795 domain-containing protein [bacterium]|nr:DUF3795 domain-containing protein [bacterium]
MDNLKADQNLISYCGLYCGACKKYLSDKCPGCRENHKAKWCKIRTCCSDSNFNSCANCDEFADVTECGKYNNFIARIFALIFRSDRPASIKRIKEIGPAAFAEEMAEKHAIVIRK